jgi:hypothetical protein
MDRFDRDILDFVRSWAPYGGPPADEVLAEFGMTRDQLFDRVHLIISAEEARRAQELRRPWLRVQAIAPAAVGAKRGNAWTNGNRGWRRTGRGFWVDPVRD